MTTKAKLRRKIKRLKKRELELIIECNAARARAGELACELTEHILSRPDDAGWMTWEAWLAQNTGELNG